VSGFCRLICYIYRCASKAGEWMLNEKAKEIKMGYYDRLVINIAEGNLSYLSELYQKLRRPIFALAMSIIGEYYAAEDIMQETFLKVTANASMYHKGTNARAWIFTIARNLCLNNLQMKKGEELNENMVEQRGGDFEERVASVINFNRMIEPLDDVERQIFVLHFYGGLKKTQIAQMMKMSPANVWAKYSRALKKLRANS